MLRARPESVGADATATVRVAPSSVSAMPGETVAVDIVIENVEALTGYTLSLRFDNAIVSTVAGSTTECAPPLEQGVPPSLGDSPYMLDCPGWDIVSGANLTVAHVVLRCDGAGVSALELTDVTLRNWEGQAYSPLDVDGAINCSAPATPTPTDTATSTPTATFTPTPTDTATPTFTPTPTLGPSPLWPDLVSYQSVSAYEVIGGELVTYAITNWNHGQQAATWVFFANEVSQVGEFVSLAGGCMMALPDGFQCGPSYLWPDNGAPGGFDEETVTFTMRAPCTAIDVTMVNHAWGNSVDEPTSAEWNNHSWSEVAVRGCPDLSGDGFIGALDIAKVVQHWLQNAPAYDIDGDGTVGALDIARIVKQWLQPCPVCP